MLSGFELLECDFGYRHVVQNSLPAILTVDLRSDPAASSRRLVPFVHVRPAAETCCIHASSEGNSRSIWMKSFSQWLPGHLRSADHFAGGDRLLHNPDGRNS